MHRSRTFGQKLQAADRTKNLKIEDLDADDKSQFTQQRFQTFRTANPSIYIDPQLGFGEDAPSTIQAKSTGLYGGGTFIDNITEEEGESMYKKSPNPEPDRVKNTSVLESDAGLDNEDDGASGQDVVNRGTFG